MSFFEGVHNAVISNSNFISAHTINYNTVCFGFNDGERIDPIVGSQRPNFTLPMIAPVVASSFRDLVTALDIVQSILSNITVSSSEYTGLIEDLRTFEDALRFIDRLLNTIPVDASIRQAMEIETTRCRELVEKFSWRAEEIESFRRKLSRHTQNINQFFYGLQIVAATSGANVMMQDLRLIKQQVAEIYAIQQRPPTGIGYDIGNALMLIDALGERITLPMQFCSSRKEFHQTLIRLFKGKIGQNHVERYDYSISTEDGKVMLASNNWGAVVKKGTVIIMNMILRKVRVQQELVNRQKNACPHCYETRVGVMPDDGWLQCRHCNCRFGWSDTAIPTVFPPAEDLTIAEFRNIKVVPVAQLSTDCPSDNSILLLHFQHVRRLLVER
ncbi:hypothetical protein GALMADRAFT_259871 [Galerina marginata CBS 339.88]|uniref:Ubiquitin-like domain-containing protein n=1 Tax=Galerina marginata (strain CBS 339.88) TaxID=685588 RepID=A0A067S7X8_GALM3|nr:hypothetical protein GALMADRAFT_259871 [Galerina marginata CBS 339.88]